MNCLVWNCRGLGNLRTGKELGDLIWPKDPSVVFLAETLAEEARLDTVQRSIDYEHKWVVPKEGRGGGLVLFWKSTVNLEVIDSSQYYIDTWIDRGSEHEWRFTGFYGELDTSRRVEAWDSLRTLNHHPQISWLCAGDFNELTRQEEKLGGAIRQHRQMQLFRDVIDECGFLDLGFVGNRFTWSKHFEDGHSIWEQLDRGLANDAWFLKFPGSIVHHLQCTSSDHCPLLINLLSLDPSPKKRIFKFEEMWLLDERCAEMVEASWSSYSVGHRDSDILKRVEICGRDLAWWNHNIFGNVRKELINKKALLVEAESAAIVSGQNGRVRKLKEEINILLDREARMWSQRSRTLWLKNGDNNTRFFHCRATKRHRKNKIRGIMDENNTWRVKSEEINSVLVKFYSDLFSTSRPNHQWPQLEYIPSMITEDMNSALTNTFTAVEVNEALKQMAPLKAPGPDGMPPLFFQHFWRVVDVDVTTSVLSWLNSGTIPHPLNHTFITLIPKIKNPKRVNDYYPISLCNVLYKIFSKVLANRLKKILPRIISEHQSTFTKNRLITDNILVAYESLHFMNNMRTGKTGYMAVKIDMSKAYDRAEWVYLENVMRKMGFSEKWIGLIMVCIKTVTYSILVNGEPQGLIQPTRGIRQGDPLSPFLFLLCTKGLHGLIQQSVRMRELKGLSISWHGPRLTHLLFADDSLLFRRATTVECRKIMEILDIYEEGSGQKVNKNKTAIFFSKSTLEDTKMEIKEAWGLQEIVHYDKYFGLPSLVGRKKKESFNFIKEKIWKKLQGWEGKLLSQAGREILIKAVIQAIPTYTMGCFKIPLGLCHEIESMVKKFWWGQRGDERKIHWLKWKKMTKSKMEGGLGFRDLAMFNDSLLAKHAWRLLQNPDSLFYNFFKARFFPNCSIMEAKESSTGSYAWRSILHGRDVLLRGCRWRVGNGRSVHIWQSSWLPRKHPTKVISPIIDSMADARVEILIDEATHRWNHSVIDGVFIPEEAKLIKSLPLPQQGVEDRLFWPFTQTGTYTSKSGYRFLKSEDESTDSATRSVEDRELWYAKENRAGVGVVIRNSEGLVLDSLSKLVLYAYSPLEIEVMATATALDFASDLGFQLAILETDSLVLVKALNEDTEFFSAVGLVLDEIRHKHHRCTAHVSHTILFDEIKDYWSIEFAKADIGPTRGCHSPRVAPSISVENRN
ncbi:hypothetical protein SO802_005223 [Lithocarpus litseifolius]|uniref:Reverse transcriptase domain-containing protein n=1 Tax=Lithocarpus litseifolius TaxID=425828 RepID=A0AAW2DLB9_9ROSI